MKEIDFLPGWYKDGQRQRQRVCRQYIVLAVAFIAMVGYNTMATHRISRASAELAQIEGRRVEAEVACQEFNTVTSHLNRVREKAALIERIDSRINVGAVLAEMSHILGETVVLSRVEFIAEPLADDNKDTRGNDTGVRAAEGKKDVSRETLVGNVRFRIVLTGVAVSPADVAALVRRLDDSSYFHRVHASFWRSGKVQVSSRFVEAAPKAQGGAGAAGQPESLDVTEFEVVCYLANYQEADNR
jgi:hypothetical protein